MLVSLTIATVICHNEKLLYHLNFISIALKERDIVPFKITLIHIIKPFTSSVRYTH